MERVYRIVFLALFILGFIGAVASADRPTADLTQDSVISLLKDVQVAQEANEINAGRWNLDVNNVNEDGLARVEELFAQNN